MPRKGALLAVLKRAAVWRATDGNSWPFGCLVRFLFLTAARRSEAQGMRWAEVNGETGDWVLPVSRNKVPRGLVRPLSAPALTVLNGLPRIGEYVFTMAGRFPIGSISKCKRLLDEASGVGGWTMHPQFRERHAEECLGHIQGGVKAIYDHHKYYNEKKMAYEALATQIELIVNSQSSNVRLNSDARARSGPSRCAASVVQEC